MGGDEGTGDGAGILTQIPHDFLRHSVDFRLPPRGSYAVGTAFMPTGGAHLSELKEALEDLARGEQLAVLGWRDVPVVEEAVGASARAVMERKQNQMVSARDRAAGSWADLRSRLG